MQASGNSIQARAKARSALALSSMLVVLSACGGGGGDGGSSAPTDGGGTSSPTDVPTDTGGGVRAPDLNLSQDAFHFVPDSAMGVPGAIDTLGGGTALLAAWNPRDPQTVLKPGMKVMFFGAAEGCAAGTQGPLVGMSNQRLGELAGLTGQPATGVGSGLNWTPSGNTAGCDADTRGRSGGSSVFLNADDQAGAVGMLTTSGPQSDGQAAFLGPFGSGGQNGAGANAFITGSFVNFRQTWWAADPLQPWIGSARARVRSVQSNGSVTIDPASGSTTQVKQQMVATFLNLACTKDPQSKGKACQVQYLFNTAIQRINVSDWSKVGWFQKGQVWFDPAQGGIPVVDGPIFASGTPTLEATTGRALFVSQGAATQHATFANLAFDVTISFDQLQSVLRIVTARTLGVALDSVSDAQLAAQWGPSWNDRSAWQLLTADVGQEVHNPDPSLKAEIAGGFASLYVGPQP